MMKCAKYATSMWSRHSNRAPDSAICYHTKLPIKTFLQRLANYQSATLHGMERSENPKICNKSTLRHLNRAVIHIQQSKLQNVIKQ